MKILVLIIGIVFLAIIATLEVWKRLVPAKSKRARQIEIVLIILAFIGGGVGLIRQAVSPSKDEVIRKTVAAVWEKGTVPIGELKVAYQEIGELKEQLTKAVERANEAEKRGDVPEAEGIIEELRKSGDISRLLEFLVKDRDVQKDELIERNREIAAVAYLKGDIGVASDAVDEILKFQPENLFALNQRGNILRLRGSLNGAEDCYQRVLDLAIEGDLRQAQAAAFGNLGVIYMDRGDLDKAVEMLKEALKINEEIRSKEGMAINYGNLGLIYQRWKYLDKAEEMFTKILEIHRMLKDQEGMSKDYGNLGLIYYTRGDRGDLDKAEKMYKKALEINKKLGRLEGMAIDYGNLGNVYGTKDELDKAEEMLKRALEIMKKIGNKEGMAGAYSNLGLVYEDRGKKVKAREYWEKAVELYKSIEMPREVEKVKRFIDRLSEKGEVKR